MRRMTLLLSLVLLAVSAAAPAATRAERRAERRAAKIAKLQAQTRALQAQTEALEAQNQGGAAAPAGPSSGSAGDALTVTLKDGQKADLTLKSYDRFFLTALNSKGTRFDIPWTQIASVDMAGASAGADLALMRGSITDDHAAVDIVVEPRSPRTAFEKALWPGLILHGSGFRYAGDKDTFVNLAGAEFFGILVGAFGLYLDASPNKSDTSKVVPESLTIAGAAVFVVTWVWDLAFAPGSAQALDSAKGLALLPRPDGAELSYRF